MNDDEEEWEFEGEPLNNIFSDEMYPDQIYPKKCSNTENYFRNLQPFVT